MTAGALLVAAGMGVVAAGPGLAAHVAGTVVLGLGLAGILGSSLSYILLNEAGAEERTVAQGLSTLFISVGQLVGAAALAAAAASVPDPAVGYRTGFAVVAVVGLALAVVARALPARAASG